MAERRIGFRRTHQAVGLFFAILVAHRDMFADANPITGVRRHHGVAHDVLQFGNLAFKASLVFLGLVVCAVLGEVSVVGGAPDLIGNFWPLDAFEKVEFSCISRLPSAVSVTVLSMYMRGSLLAVRDAAPRSGAQ
jgi:hypothetical protein